MEITYFKNSKTEIKFEQNSFQKNFSNIIENPKVGFFQYQVSNELKTQLNSIKNKFKHIKNFIQIGIGGSALGPQMLLDALEKESLINFIFLDNIDPEDTYTKLKNINLKESLIYVVSKSGTTAETMACFNIITSMIIECGVKIEDFKNYFIFCTGRKGDLFDISNKLNIEVLDLPENIGGRFSVQTPVGLLPLIFANIDLEEFSCGLEKAKVNLLNSLDLHDCAAFILGHKYTGYNETVLMPYSSKLKSVSSWFTQLWAESLGKKYNLDGDEVFEGLTPLQSYGATDQHSQLQLFMEGPRNKIIIFINIKKFAVDYKLESPLNAPSLDKLKKYTMGQLIHAEIDGTKKALESDDRPYICINIEQNDVQEITHLILFFQSLTALMGKLLNINPFDQPGVEAGKKYAFELLKHK